MRSAVAWTAAASPAGHRDDPDCLGYVGAPEWTGAGETMGCDQFDLNSSVDPPRAHTSWWAVREMGKEATTP